MLGFCPQNNPDPGADPLAAPETGVKFGRWFSAPRGLTRPKKRDLRNANSLEPIGLKAASGVKKKRRPKATGKKVGKR